MMHQCYTDISAEQLNLMQERTPIFVDIIKEQGRITYQQFIDNCIEPGTTTIDRDSLTHIRHWSEIVNHHAVTKRFHDERMERDPRTIAERKLKELEGRVDAAKQKKQDAKDAKLLKDYEEKIRKQSLTPAEAKAERNIRKEAAAAKKELRQSQETNQKIGYLTILGRYSEV